MSSNDEAKDLELEAITLSTATVSLPPLKLGDKGSAVRLLQKILIAKQFLDKRLYDANFKQSTEQAVKKWQDAQKLSVSGKVDEETWKNLTDHI
ncbi:peptidoglycan-binding protein [Aetokthonos hydrillicola Thurmond2011]|uniref:Peptidoglycan-binding protein n=1 Tax=Aetokthonos hydrillicola Thurmond2011 TaxID=2712845 RepID=A0AAP5IH88_9CYAN|nr:peptidoglycan-binding domain-containing protein [Aetokthonos hydrillicola]MBO3463456.1 peptidoglycan-binding protein [Aetokthonos hydrillicola CCALA 1050]MBW4591166.1 peptidoglycan-binding protein [Aetokthonos hydrillicola CCALA 1050]MDR9900537.1 peptidoglycan-binding protein [Aetokthonos hydrillicola Thurmond2011]